MYNTIAKEIMIPLEEYLIINCNATINYAILH